MNYHYQLVKKQGLDTVMIAETVVECVSWWEDWQNRECSEEEYEIVDTDTYEVVLTISPKCPN